MNDKHRRLESYANSVVAAAEVFRQEMGGNDNGHCKTCHAFLGECEPRNCSEARLLQAIDAYVNET